MSSVTVTDQRTSQSHLGGGADDAPRNESLDARTGSNHRMDGAHCESSAAANSVVPSESVGETSSKALLNDDQVQRISRAIADPQRLAILTRIAEQDEVPCKILVATFSIKQATISHHLKELVGAELIESRKQGQRAILSCRRDVCDAYVKTLRSRFVNS